MKKHIILGGFVFVLGLVALGGRADAASYGHMDRLALQIQNNSAELYREFQLHYRHVAEYPHLLSDARTMYDRARHIHVITHAHGSLHHVERDLADLDRFYHHLESLLRQVESGWHHGHVHGDTLHVQQLMKQIECDIHHLRKDLAELRPGHIGYGHGGIVYPGHGAIIIRPGHGVGFHRPPVQRNYGEIRSGWKRGLKDL